ncbi:glycosyltransferase [Almyronema epifaneia]|uniref:Glycosyltransferase n=1 Tax=Almyronema epifaneia S1 TaxID=2991925 RepID=A0ABW6IGE6_9CYAN
MVASTVLENMSAFYGNTRSQLKKRTLLFRYLAIINIIVGFWYLQWRVAHSLNSNVLWFSVPLLLAEIYSYLGGVMFMIGLWRPLQRQVRSLDRLIPEMPPQQWPTVDVFITCYNEPPDLVEQTIRAALALDYLPQQLRVYVLDDGNSPELRSVAERLCLEDLQSPALIRRSEQLQQQRQALIERLAQLQQLQPQTEVAESCLTTQSAATESSFHLLQVFAQGLRLLNPEHPSLSDRLSQEIAQTQVAIHHQELALADLARCRYIARPKPSHRPHHAKAGNINYAIFSGKTAGAFILTLDADHVPKPQFLKRVLPYFFNYNLFTGQYEPNRIAFVQTPQGFYNLPQGDPFGHQAHLFYGPIQQGKDGLNSAFYTGTNALMRREALVNVGLQNFSAAFSADEKRLEEFDLIGGLSSSSITEDMNTAMRLHASGWRSIYHDELLAEGLAPDDLSSTLKQRLRWAQGTIQVLKTENPLTKPGLSCWQRLQYFQTMYSYFAGFAALVFLACPIIYFFTGLIPVEAFGPEFALYFFPAFLINRLTFLTVAWGIPAREIWRSEQYAIALFPLFIQAVWSVFSKQPLKFQVTPKQRQSGIYLKLVWPQIFVFSLTVTGIFWGLGQLLLNRIADPIAYGVNVGWGLYGLVLLWTVIRASVWQPDIAKGKN